MSGTPHSKQKAARPLHSVIAQGGAQANVIIEVGPERKKYHVHKAFLIYHSEYFRKALSGTWKEAEDGIVKLVDIEPAIFNLFVEWLYTQAVPTTYVDYTIITNANTYTEDMCKIMLYVFADRFRVPKLRTAMNRQIVSDTDVNEPRLWAHTPILYAFTNLPPTDPLLDPFVDRYFMQWAGDLDTVDILPQDFLRRFFTRVGSERVRRGNKDRGIFAMDVCSYHEHATVEDKLDCPNRSRGLYGKTPLRRLDGSESRT